jgi:hypothetical protein
MNNVWNRVVQDLEVYAEKERRRKSTINRVIAYLKKTLTGCGGDCEQGRSPCNCEKRYGN